MLPKEEQVRTQLGQPLSARYAGVDVGQVVLELAQRAGVDLDVDPGAYERVPAADRSIQLTLDNATVQQALDDDRRVHRPDVRGDRAGRPRRRAGRRPAPAGRRPAVGPAGVAPA